jgi:DNA-binding transcriptional LysR family regulator
VRTASAEAGAVAGTVRITASEIIGVEVLPPILSALKARHPGLSFELALSNRIEDLLRHDADIAVRMTRPAQDGLLARKVALIPLAFYCHETYIARNGAPLSLPDLIASGAMIGYDRDPALLRAVSGFGLSAKPADFGVGICQHAIAARDPKLRHVLPAFTHALETWLVTHPDLRNVRRVRATLDALANGLARYADAPLRN